MLLSNLAAVQQAAIRANEGEYPVQIVFGVVLSEAPLAILVDQRLTVTAQMLYLSSSVQEKTEQCEVQWSTGQSNGTSGSHSHGITGTKEITFHNGLKKGEEVLMLRMQGGQRFYVLDRVVRG